MKNILSMVLATILLLIVFGNIAQAEYSIGVDDVLEIIFWQERELNQRVIVNSQGKINLSVTGEITAAGLTPKQLGRKIVEQVSRFNREISQAVVSVLEYNSNAVFVEGQVLQPGRYAREVIPDLWTIIKEMGGVTDFGDLHNVKIIRGGKKDPGKVISVDVLAAVLAKDIDNMPKIYAHDLIKVERSTSGVVGSNIPSETNSLRNEYYILGAVARPGAITLKPGTDLLEAIAIAGGFLPTADLSKVRVNSKANAFATIYEVDLEKQSKTGMPRRYIITAEDVIIVPIRSSGLFGRSFAVIRDVLTLAGTITSTILLVDRFSN